jgi:hypothetical protein
MGALAGKLAEDLPPKAVVGNGKRLDNLDAEDKAAIIALHVEEPHYSAVEIAGILTDRGFVISANPVRAWLRDQGVYRS